MAPQPTAEGRRLVGFFLVPQRRSASTHDHRRSPYRYVRWTAPRSAEPHRGADAPVPPVFDPRFALDPVRQGHELAIFLRLLTPVVLVFAVVELLAAVAFEAWGPAVTGVTLAAFAIWARFAVRPAFERGSIGDRAFQIALGLLTIHIVAVVSQPTEFGALAAATSLAVLFGLTYVDRRRLLFLMVLAGVSSVLCVLAIIATDEQARCRVG